MDLIPIECGSCKAKLRIKANPAKMPAEVKCPKCGKPIPVGKSPAPAPVSAQVPPPPKPTPTPPVQSVPPPPSSTAQLTAPPKPVSTPPSPATGAPKKAAAPIVLNPGPEGASTATIVAQCPACHWQTKVTQNLIGKKIRCKQCSGIILVMSPETPEADPPVRTPQATPEPVPQARQPEPPPVAKPVPQEAVVQPPPTPVAQWSTPQATLDLSAARNASVSPGTTVLVAEISSLKARLEAASRESASQAQRTSGAEKRAEVAETRLREAEKALHDLAGKNALDSMASNRRVAELEARLSELNGHVSSLVEEYKSELGIAESRAAQLRDKLRYLGA